MESNQKKYGVEEQLTMFKRRRSEIPTAERLQTLQDKLYQKAKQEPNFNTALYQYYNRKSQRKSSLYGQKAFEILVNKYKLIDPTKY